MSIAQSQIRADAVTRLWDFKRLCDSRTAAGMPLIHFNMLLSDPDYREGMLSKAEESSEPELKRIAASIRAMQIHGPLRGQANGSAAMATPAAPNSIRLPASGGGGGADRVDDGASFGWLGLLIGGGLLFVASLTAAWLYWQQDGPRRIEVTGNITTDTAWKSGNTYTLQDLTFVESRARLTIEPGVTVRGAPGSALVVTRDATLHARGRADAPIVFTSAQALGKRRAGDWGGVVLLGNAPVNRDAHVEGIEANDSRGDFGGNDATSSCGVLDYVRVEFAGFEISKDNELNGLTLGGCGSGTIVRHVQVHRSLDDGVEMFGGTADLRHVLITGAGDDSLDWDWGWRGRVQFLIAQQHPNSGDNAFEADNNGNQHDAEPMSEPVMYNVTLVSPRSHTRHHRAMTLREGTGGHFHNLFMHGFSGEAVDIKDAVTVGNLDNGRLSFEALAINDIGGRGIRFFEDESGDADDDGGLDEAAYFRDTVGARFGVDPQFSRDVSSTVNPDFAPGGTSGLRDGAVAPPQGEFWDESALYIGAIRPGAARDWTDGWTDFPLN